MKANDFRALKERGTSLITNASPPCVTAGRSAASPVAFFFLMSLLIPLPLCSREGARISQGVLTSALIRVSACVCVCVFLVCVINKSFTPRVPHQLSGLSEDLHHAVPQGHFPASVGLTMVRMAPCGAPTCSLSFYTSSLEEQPRNEQI